MRSQIFSIGLVILFLGNGCSPNSADSTTPTSPPRIEVTALSVPFGEAPQIDGKTESGEWEGAIIEGFADQSQLFLMRDEAYLYLAIRSSTPEMIAANIYLSQNDEISIHHASAALGTAIYQKEVGDWLKTQDFVWQCRATNNSESAIAERDAFLQSEGWLAANSRIGTPNELEYQIRITEENLSLAVAFMRTSEPDLRIYWPIDIADGTTKPTPDGLPETQSFSPDTWEMLDLSVLE